MQREQWFHRAVIYQVDSSLFYDANGDGYGDLAGIRQKLHYIRSLGATVLWLTPFYLTPLQDDGYDISDHLQPDPRFGTIADVIELIARARELGLRVIVELVIQHTSAQHPWFQAARRDPRSPWRPYYLWADRPPEKDDPPMFPGVEESVWRWDEQAGQYYRHMFYRHEPDLNLAHPPVIAEIENIITFWLQAGVSGFRLDAASHLVKQAGKGDEARGYPLLNHLRQVVQRLNPEAILLGEVDVAVEDYRHYFGHSDRLQMVLNFWLNKYLYLSLAQQRAAPVVKALQAMVTPPDGCCFVNWLALPGVPVMRYGDEIGMGDDLSLPERYAVRTPMQWSAAPNGGFSRAARDDLPVKPIASGRWRYQRINVEAALRHPRSLLNRVRNMVLARAEYTEPGSIPFAILAVKPAAVLGLCYRSESREVLMLANCSQQAVEVLLPPLAEGYWSPILEDKLYQDGLHGGKDARLALSGYGYRWFSRSLD